MKSKSKWRGPDFSGFVSALRPAIDLLLAPLRLFQWLCSVVGFLTLTTLGAIVVYSIYFVHSLPAVETMEFAQFKVLGQRAVVRHLENKATPLRWTPIGEISRDLLYSVVMSEDSEFFEHEGFDVNAIVTSLAVNVKKGRYEYGASTISQQVVKNVFLTHEKTLVRKAKELLLTEKIERRFGKNEILEVYLNLAEFGPDLFGVAAASQHFFGKKASQINAAEGAFMALMLPSPRRNYYAIFQNHNLAPQKRRKIRRVLGDMLANEFISPKQYQRYIHYSYFKK